MSKKVDISALCPSLIQGHQALLLYLSLVGEPIVQIVDQTYESNQELIVLDYKSMGRSEMLEMKSFRKFAESWGMRPDQLADIVFAEA